MTFFQYFYHFLWLFQNYAYAHLRDLVIDDHMNKVSQHQVSLNNAKSRADRIKHSLEMDKDGNPVYDDADAVRIRNQFQDNFQYSDFSSQEARNSLHSVMASAIAARNKVDREAEAEYEVLFDNMPAGPVDVIIPGVSVFRRKSTGQMFEAVTRALGIGEMPIKELMEKHGDEIKKFDEGSVFQFMGEEFSAPCGINHIIRLDHDSADKQSFSYLKTNYNFNLRFGEMELLNLASRGAYSILNELDIRSLNKHTDSYTKVANLQRTGIAPHEPMNSPHFKNFMRYLGWDFNDFAPITNEDVDERWNELIDLISNDELDIFDEYAKSVEEDKAIK